MVNFRGIMISMKIVFLVTFGALFPFLLCAEEYESFSRYDANGDKVVTYAELAREKKLEFDNHDRNRDRLISETEFQPGEGEETSKFDLFASSEFSKIDADGNTTLSLVEFGNFVRDLINELDKNADNAVSAEEYHAAVIAAKERDAALAPKGSAPKGSAPKPN